MSSVVHRLSVSHGRALIALGEYDVGRQEMLVAAGLFTTLAGSQHYDRERCLGEAAETYRRLVMISLDKQHHAEVSADHGKLMAAVGKISDPSRQRFFHSALEEIQKRMAHLFTQPLQAGP